MRHYRRRCGHAPGPLAPDDQVVVDAFRSMLAALGTPEPWTPGTTRPVAVRIGAAVERARPRPGDTDGPDTIAVTLEHPDGPHTPHGTAYRQLGWRHCDIATTVLGMWNPAYSPLTHAAAGLDLPDPIPLAPAHYAVHVQAHHPGPTRTLLQLGPYTQTAHAYRDANRITAALRARPAGRTITATTAPYDPNRHRQYADPYAADLDLLLAEAVV
ncbi:hypothetical protein LXH09_37105 [Streptomyces sp. CS7]|uniref:hypothetical protein n=1 Tax=Streptomyces sp. CS-7 TaxID=2906769 RepID=UPI0021B2681C|nr:hypothetical protein [Streptomyces sp. CS-7]MCT6782243.1 hypothetical protein [Streptomyces sp. CS-7]